MAGHSDGVRPAGIRDVAWAAGVPVASASFALNGQPGLAPETRKRILAAAERLGYRANRQARALRQGHTSMYGIVVRNFANPFLLDVLTGAEQVARQAGATLLFLGSRVAGVTGVRPGNLAGPVLVTAGSPAVTQG